MKVIISSLMVIGLALLSVAVVEWLPRFSQPSTPVHAVGFSVYPPRTPDQNREYHPVNTAAQHLKSEGIEGSASGLAQLAHDVIQASAESSDSPESPTSPELPELASSSAESTDSPESPESYESPSAPELAVQRFSEPVADDTRRAPEKPHTIEWAETVAPVAARRTHTAVIERRAVRSRPPATPAPVVLAERLPKRAALTVQVVSAAHKKPVKANVYVQRENGVNVSSQRYVARARFNLPLGRYKVTVRADGHQDLVRTLTVGQRGVSQAFALRHHTPRPARTQVATNAQQQARRQARRQEQQRKQAQHRREQHKQAQQKQAQQRQSQHQVQRPVQSAPPRPVARVVQPSQRPVQRVQTVPRTGRLQLHAVSATDGQPLAVNFRITAVNGKTLHHAPRVAYAEMNVPAGQARIHIQHQGLSGSEVVHIQPGATTAHTFSVVPSTQVAATHPTAQRRVLRPRLGLGVGIGPLVFRIR